ncbi:MAG: FHA domain-containing protein [Prosthecobacter sp.]|uniref:FHA domain-containing protein n=1 Tax=Prosthecobacter sp. TaxID=1965333 RepID=UPI003BB1DB47
MPLSGGETCVGSDPSVQIPVRAEMGLMPRHFVIAELDGGWHLGAYDGAAVWVNGQPVRVTALHDGDRIVAGQLELIYRDVPEATRGPVMQAQPILMPNSFQPLQIDPPPMMEEHEQPSVVRTPMPERVPSPRVIYRTELGDVTSLAGGKRDHLLMILIGLVLIGIGGLITKLAFFDVSGPLKPADLVIKEGRITGVSVRGRKANRTTELHTDLGLPRTIELPDDLRYNPMWSRPGSVAKIGFVKEHFDNKKLNMLGTQGTLRVATLEVDGASFRSLAKHNAAEESQNQLFALAGPGMVLGGLFVMMLGWEKWKSRRAARR